MCVFFFSLFLLPWFSFSPWTFFTASVPPTFVRSYSLWKARRLRVFLCQPLYFLARGIYGVHASVVRGPITPTRGDRCPRADRNGTLLNFFAGTKPWKWKRTSEKIHFQICFLLFPRSRWNGEGSRCSGSGLYEAGIRIIASDSSLCMKGKRVLWRKRHNSCIKESGGFFLPHGASHLILQCNGTFRGKRILSCALFVLAFFAS